MRRGLVGARRFGDFPLNTRRWVFGVAVAAAMLLAPLALVIGLLLVGLIGDGTIIPEVPAPATPPEPAPRERSR